MFKQCIGMTESDARQIAEMYLSRYNPPIGTAAAKSLPKQTLTFAGLR